MNLKEIQQLIDIINESNLDEATIEEGDFKITLKRSSSPSPQAAVPVSLPASQPAPAEPAASAQGKAPAAETAKGGPDRNGLIEIRSPIVGTFYRSPAPDVDPFVNVNDRIDKGNVLCIVEAMKLMNEIEAEVDGTIVEILIEDGQPIEYDQVLFLVKP